MTMTDRIAEIEARVAELDVLQRPIWDEKHALQDELREIHVGLVKDIAMGQRWTLRYNERRGGIYLDLKNRGTVSDQIYEHTGGSYHHSFVFEKADDASVKLYIDDGDVAVCFSSPEMFTLHGQQYDVDTSHVEEVIEGLQAKIEVLENLIKEDA